MNNIRQIQALNKEELENCVAPSASWHTDYRDTAYVYIGGLSFDLTEGDIITIFSQFGEPVWLKLARDKETGKSKGFAWLKYEDQRSTDIAVDNLGGATILSRIIRVDHARYKDEFKVTFSDNSSMEHGYRQQHHQKARPVERSEQMRASDDEDPMKDYFTSERRERRQQGRGRERPLEDRYDERRRTKRHRDRH